MDGTLSTWHKSAEATPVTAYLDSCLRGVGQIIFMNNPITGAIILAALFVAGPWLGAMSLLGMLVGTATAHACGVDRGLIRAGLCGFNGTLIGGAMATFLSPAWDPMVIGYVLLGSVVTVPVGVALSVFLIDKWGVPGLTLPFNLVALMILSMAPRVAHGRAGELLAPSVQNSPVDAALRTAPTGGSAGTLEAIANGVLRGIGQLFFADNMWSGLMILAGIAVCSRIAAVVSVAGALIGVGTGLAVGADGFLIYHGLLGYTGFVTAVAIAGVFYVPGIGSVAYGLGAAVWATITQLGLAHLLASAGLPAMTVPFCLVTIGVLLLRDLPGLTSVKLTEITTPEEHLRVGA